MIDEDKVLIGLGQHISGRTPQRCGGCPYFNGDSGYGVSCRDELLDDIYELLETREESQEPHVLPLEELKSIGETWDKNTPPYLWVEILDAPEWYTDDMIWVPYSFIRDTIKIGSEEYNKDNYMKRWRCWNKKPTDDQRKNTPWESD